MLMLFMKSTPSTAAQSLWRRPQLCSPQAPPYSGERGCSVLPACLESFAHAHLLLCCFASLPQVFRVRGSPASPVAHIVWSASGLHPYSRLSPHFSPRCMVLPRTTH